MIHRGMFCHLLLLCLITAIGCQNADATRGLTHPAVGRQMAGVTLVPLTGEAKPLNDQALRGRVVLLNFWATWCGPCRQEFPHLAALGESLNTRADFLLVSISTGNGDFETTQEETQKFLLSQASGLATWYDPEEQTTAAVRSRFGFNGVPTTLILDRDGIVRGLWTGYLRGDEKEQAALINKLLDDTQTEK